MSSRVAKNTFYKLGQTLFSAIIGILTTRILILTLGFEGFGVFFLLFSLPNLVNFLQPGLTVSAVSFMSIAIGKSTINSTSKIKNYSLKQIFNTYLFCYFVIALILIILAIPIGSYLIFEVFDLGMVNTESAYVIFIIGILCVCISLLSSPYRSICTANQNFKILEIVTMGNKILNFSLIYPIGWGILNINTLIQYGIVRLFTNILTNLWIILYASKKYNQASFDFSKIKNFACLGEIMSFTSLKFLSQSAFIFRNETLKVITNIFFGPLGTSSLTVSNQIFQNVDLITNSLPQALSPQLGRFVGQNKFTKIHSITALSSKIMIFFSAALIFPIILNLKFLVSIWINNFNNDIEILCIVMLLSGYVNSSSIIYAKAVTMLGKIKQFEILTSIIYLGVLPALYFSLLGNKYIFFIPAAILLGSILQSINRISSFSSSYKIKFSNYIISWFYSLGFTFVLECLLFFLMNLLKFEDLLLLLFSIVANTVFLFLYFPIAILTKDENELMLNQILSLLKIKGKKIIM